MANVAMISHVEITTHILFFSFSYLWRKNPLPAEVHNFWQDLLGAESRSRVARESECHYCGEHSSIHQPFLQQVAKQPSGTPTTFEV